MNQLLILDKEEINVFGKIFFSFTSDALETLNSLVNSNFQIDKFIFQTCNSETKEQEALSNEGFEGIELRLEGILNGSVIISFDKPSIEPIICAMGGEDILQEFGYDITFADALGEIGNLIAHRIIGNWTNYIGAKNEFSIPKKVTKSLNDYAKSFLSDENSSLCIFGANITEKNKGWKGKIYTFLIFPNKKEFRQTFLYLKEKVPPNIYQ